MLAWLATALFAHAASTDPDLKWRTISTEHFDIHFHQGVEQVADEYGRMVEDVFERMTGELRWRPRGARIQVVLIDRTDIANGFASSVPYPHITIYVTAPTEDSTLQLYEDWNEAIFTHELTHVLHMDTNHGIVRLARAVVGRIASTNSLSPLWTIEGFATFQETRQTAGGRGRATWPDMIKRTAVVEDAFPPLGNLDGFQPMPPSGNLRYLFGQDFIQYVADHHGQDVWTRWIHTYGGWIPYWLPGRRALGEGLLPLYREWREATTAEYLAQAEAIRAEGVLPDAGRLVSRPEASCAAPAYSPDGDKLVWSCYDLRLGSQIWLADGDGFGQELLLQNFGAGYFTWRRDSKAFVYAANHVVNQFNVWSDIYMYTLGGGITPLTGGARARDPDFSPDGSRLLYVTNGGQHNQLEVMTVDRARKTLTDHDDHTQYSTPRFSPDGRWIALSVWRDGMRDLWLYDAEGHPYRRLTMDTAIDADPVWSADGRWLFFGSDRSGVPNVYAIELETERLWQVTNSITGAVQPTVHPSGDHLAFVQYSNDGWDVWVMDLDPSKYLDRGLLPRPIRYGAPLPKIREPEDAEPREVAAGTAATEEPPAEAPVQDGSGGSPMDGSAWEGAGLPDASPARFRNQLRPVGPPGPLDPLAATRPWSVPGLVSSLPAGRGPGRTADQSSEVLDSFGDIVVEDAFGEEKDYPFHIRPKRYNPLPTLRPFYALPYLALTPYAPRDPFGFTCADPQVFCPSLLASVATGASDALGRYAWGGSLSYRTDAAALSGGLGFTVNRFLPVYSFGVSSAAVPGPQLQLVGEPTLTEGGELNVGYTVPPTVYWHRRNTAVATVSWPYKLRSTAFAQYSFSESRPRFPLPPNVYEPSVPFIGYAGAVSAGWRYAWSEPTAYAISAEDGEVFSFVASLRHPWLGSFARNLETDRLEPLTQLQLASEIRKYHANPVLKNHVLAYRAAAGVTFGQNRFFGNYLLGGSIGDSAFLVTPDELRMVRGYPYAVDAGDLYWLGSVEYRFPLLRVERGVGPLPVYGRTLSGAVYVDAGNAFVSPSLETGVPPTALEWWEAATAEPLIGVGGELTWRMVLGWGIGLSGRIGYGVGLTGPGLKPVMTTEDGGTTVLRPVYFQLGASF